MKILYVSTLSNTINAFMVPHIQMLLNQGHQVDIASNCQKKIDDNLVTQGCKIYDVPFNRSPLDKKNFSAYKKIKDLIIYNDYELVHTHTPVASALVRLACKKRKKVKVLYTAHGFHFFKGAPLKNWLIYYPLEKWLSKYTDTIITINKEDFKRAKKHFTNVDVEYMPGVGFNYYKFRDTKIDLNKKKNELNIPLESFVILSVGELNKNKNHEVIIKAIARLNNPQLHYVLCGEGSLKNYLSELSKKMNISDRVHFLGHRKDINEIYKASDVFVFPSQREGLGMAALEAMACGLPIITSDVHGIIDYSINGVTGYVCNSEDVDDFSAKIKNIYENSNLRKEFSIYNTAAAKKYNISNSIEVLAYIYEKYSKNKRIG